MKIALIAALSIGTAASLPLAVIANADNNDQQFASPSGDIRCIFDGQGSTDPIALCQIGNPAYWVSRWLSAGVSGYVDQVDPQVIVVDPGVVEAVAAEFPRR